jgi:hypothetical protein
VRGLEEPTTQYSDVNSSFGVAGAYFTAARAFSFSLNPAFFIGQTADRPVKLALSAEVLASTKRVRTSFRSLNMMAASQLCASISL